MLSRLSTSEGHQFRMCGRVRPTLGRKCTYNGQRNPLLGRSGDGDDRENGLDLDDLDDRTAVYERFDRIERRWRDLPPDRQDALDLDEIRDDPWPWR